MPAVVDCFKNKQKILVIVSARASQFYSFFYELPPDVKPEISLLCQPKTAQDIPENFPRLITKSARISLATLEPDILRALKNEPWDAIVILYNNREGTGYELVNELALSLPAAQKYVYDIDGNLERFDAEFLKLKYEILPQRKQADITQARQLVPAILKNLPPLTKLTAQPKIIFLTSQGFNLPAARVRCFFLAAALEKLGWQTEVLSTVTHLGFKEEWELTLTEKMTANQRIIEHLAPQKNYVIYLQRLDYHAWAVLQLWERSGIPFILDYDDWDLHFLPLPEIFQPPFNDGESLLRYFIQHSLFSVVSSRSLENYFSKFSERVLYLPTGVYPPNFPASQPAAPNSKIIMSWLGTVLRLSNLNDLVFTIAAFKKIAARFPNVSLEILATGRYLGRAKSFAQGNPQVVFKDWLTPQSVAAYLNSVDIGLLPLVEDSPFNRAKSPTKLFEYMYLGKAVLASAIGEATEIIQDGGNGFLFGDEAEFLAKLEILLKNPQLRQQMGLNARATILDKYTLEQQAHKLANRLKQL